MAIREETGGAAAGGVGERLLSGTIKDDLIAGITVALVGLPQCLAYAMMSGLPPAYGLSTAAVPGLIAAIAGKSAQVVTGPTNTTGLLILAALGPYLAHNGLLSADGLPVLATLTLMAGLVRVIASYAGGAHLLRFLPESVLVGFTAGAGILIGVMQLDEALGLTPVRGSGLWGEIEGLFRRFSEGDLPKLPAVATTIVTVIAVAVGGRHLARWPIALLVVVAAIVVAWATGLDAASGLPLVQDRASIPSGWPAAALPTFDPSIVANLALPAAAITLLGTLELTVVARAGGAHPDMKREIRAQGLANAVGAFAGAFPASASLTRSALLKLGGARTRVAAAVAAIAVVPILLFASETVGYIPQATLAGVLLITAYGMLNRRRIGRMWVAAPETRILMVVTGAATLLLPLEWAIILGAGLGLVLHLAKTSVPRITVLEPRGERLVPVAKGEQPEIVVLEVSGNLHYAAVESFITRARELLPPRSKIVVLDLSHAHDLRFAALAAFEELSRDLGASGVELRLAGVSADFASFVRRAGSPLSVTRAELEPGLSVRRCLAGECDARPAERARD